MYYIIVPYSTYIKENPHILCERIYQYVRKTYTFHGHTDTQTLTHANTNISRKLNHTDTKAQIFQGSSTNTQNKHQARKKERKNTQTHIPRKPAHFEERKREREGARSCSLARRPYWLRLRRCRVFQVGGRGWGEATGSVSVCQVVAEGGCAPPCSCFANWPARLCSSRHSMPGSCFVRSHGHSQWIIRRIRSSLRGRRKKWRGESSYFFFFPLSVRFFSRLCFKSDEKVGYILFLFLFLYFFCVCKRGKGEVKRCEARRGERFF